MLPSASGTSGPLLGRKEANLFPVGQLTALHSLRKRKDIVGLNTGKHCAHFVMLKNQAVLIFIDLFQNMLQSEGPRRFDGFLLETVAEPIRQAWCNSATSMSV